MISQHQPNLKLAILCASLCLGVASRVCGEPDPVASLPRAEQASPVRTGAIGRDPSTQSPPIAMAQPAGPLVHATGIRRAGTDHRANLCHAAAPGLTMLGGFGVLLLLRRRSH